jgi:hypothetical protein
MYSQGFKASRAKIPSASSGSKRNRSGRIWMRCCFLLPPEGGEGWREEAFDFLWLKSSHPSPPLEPPSDVRIKKSALTPALSPPPSPLASARSRRSAAETDRRGRNGFRVRARSSCWIGNGSGLQCANALEKSLPAWAGRGSRGPCQDAPTAAGEGAVS